MRPAFSSAMISSVVANGIEDNAGAEFGKALFYAKPVRGCGRISRGVPRKTGRHGQFRQRPNRISEESPQGVGDVCRSVPSFLNTKALTLVIGIPIVRHMANQSIPLDRIFQALSDPTRRAVVERLTLGPASVSELARPFSMALPSFSQHLNVLEESGLVISRKSGRVRTYTLETETLAGAQDWLQLQRDKWTRRLDQLDNSVLQMKGT